MASTAQPPLTQEEQQQLILDRLVELTGGGLIRDEEVEFFGKKIVLPEGTTLDENIDFLVRLREELEEPAEYGRTFTFKVWDVAYATTQALRKAFGSMRHTGSFLEPPQLIDIPCGPNKTVQVPFGQFIVPALPRVTFSVDVVKDEKLGKVGRVNAWGPKKHKVHIESVFHLIEEYVREHSLYKGKAFTDQEKPDFIDTDAIDPSKIIYSAEVTAQLGANVYARLDHPEEMERLGVPFKSAILLEGEFGVGKTEALNLIAKRAVERKVTFIKVASGGDLMQAMQTARMYSPAIVAFEDVDSVGSAETESDRIHQVLEAFDGQQAKLSPVMVLITTNFVDTLHKGMVRPGRIDAIIHIGPPDAEGIRKLIEARTPIGLLAKDINWEQVCESMQEYFPSFVVEATSRAMRYSVMRTGRINQHGIKTEDLDNAAKELRRQFEIHSGASTSTEKPELDRALKKIVQDAIVGDTSEGLEGQLSELVEEDGDKTRTVISKKAAAIARHVSEESKNTRTHDTTEEEQTRELIEDRT